MERAQRTPLEERDAVYDPAILEGDLREVRRIYAEFLARSPEGAWDKPPPRGAEGWTLHETIAHLSALNGAGLESLESTLRGEHYTFVGLDTRYLFKAYNRAGIDRRVNVPRNELCAEFLGILDRAATIAHDLQPDAAALTAEMPIYNRRVRVDEVLSILIFHTGLGHTAQVTDATGLPPLWTQLSPAFRHRSITRTMLPLSLLYRPDIGGSLRATIAFRVDGPGGGQWFVQVAPDHSEFGEGAATRPTLVIHLRDTGVFCQMLTGRLRLPTGLATGKMRLRGDLRLFFRMKTLFSEDARPKDGRDRHVEDPRAAREPR
jgi:hypothetical protein